MDFIVNIDFSILNFIQEHIRNSFLDPVMMVLSYMGEYGVFWILLAIILLFFRKTRAAGVCVLAAMALGFLCGDIIIKNIIARPSGHSISAFAAVTALFGMLKEKRWIAYSGLVLAILIVFSRMYNYVHYPSDILGGITLGIITGLFMVFIFKKTKLDKRLSGELKKNN